MNCLCWNFNLSAPYSFWTLSACSKNTLNKNKPVLTITASMNMKVILSIIENNQCLTDDRCFWGLSNSLFQNRSIISGFVLLCRQLTLYRFPGCLNIHYHQFECCQKVKKRWRLSASIISLAIRKRWSMFFAATGILSIWSLSQ